MGYPCHDHAAMEGKMKRQRDKHHPFGNGETPGLEFKRATNRLPSNFFETVCAFLNMDGGLIVLGVEDDGDVSGVAPDAVAQIKANIANLSNNPQKLDPPYLLFPHEQEVDGKQVIKVQVPASSQVHQVNGSVFLRSEDGDYRIKDPYQIAGLVNRKLSFYTEQRVLPWRNAALRGIPRCVRHDDSIDQHGKGPSRGTSHPTSHPTSYPTSCCRIAQSRYR